MGQINLKRCDNGADVREPKEVQCDNFASEYNDFQQVVYVSKAHMNRETFHIHGDNIIECERMVDYIAAIDPGSTKTYSFLTPSCPIVTLDFVYCGERHTWKFVFYPGFNKSSSSRWDTDIYSPIKSAGGFLDETPDAVISRDLGEFEEILVAIEFCSALQAGNQAWQRSGRALSTARSGCPYLYIVDFVKYELDTNTRERKALRFPNPVVPYSYINYSYNSDIFSAQVYVKAEEFQPSFDSKLSGFSNDLFGEKDLSEYIVLLLLGRDTRALQDRLLEKNYRVVEYLALLSNGDNSFNADDWKALRSSRQSVVEYAVVNCDFSCDKKIARKSVSSSTVLAFRDLVKKYSHGIASNDIPLGVIGTSDLPDFVGELKRLYPGETAIDEISLDRNLVVCLIKGFKPRGDDNRPDRGILPLSAMLSSVEYDVLTFLYGPFLNTNYELLLDNPAGLASRNGLWKAILSLSDFVLLDCPVLHGSEDATQALIDNRDIKRKLLKYTKRDTLAITSIKPSPVAYAEDDVDTAIHVLFEGLSSLDSFEGMCNPPGGDWSGFSLTDKSNEYRWLSLPRVSGARKRPDHVTELFDASSKPVLLITESKGVPNSLERNIGQQLKDYLSWLLGFAPSVEKNQSGEWDISRSSIRISDYKLVTAGAFLSSPNTDFATLFDKTGCDLLFDLSPLGAGWRLSIHSNSEIGRRVANSIAESTPEGCPVVISLEDQ